MNNPIKAGELAESVSSLSGNRVKPGTSIIIDVQAGTMHVDMGVQGYTADAKTDEARFVLASIEDFLGMFLEKNEKYAKVQEAGYDLGPQGVIPDINRKVGILVDRIWYENQTPGESSREVIMDLIGHLFLLMYKMEVN